MGARRGFLAVLDTIAKVGKHTCPVKCDKIMKLMVTKGISEGNGILRARKLSVSDLISFDDRLANYLGLELGASLGCLPLFNHRLMNSSGCFF